MSLLNLHPGLRLSAIGGVIFFLGMATLLFAPSGVSVVVMLAGGMGVWVGFLWTIFSWYVPTSHEDGET